jgi:hypothetical protein
MADPLSAVASILALLAAVQQGARLVSKLCNAPDEISLLEKELQHVAAVLQDVKKLLPDNNLKRESLSQALFSLESTMDELNMVINRRVSTKRRLWKVWWSWIRNATRVKELRVHLETARTKVTEALSVQNL